jgi:hypothetical protein
VIDFGCISFENFGTVRLLRRELPAFGLGTDSGTRRGQGGDRQREEAEAGDRALGDGLPSITVPAPRSGGVGVALTTNGPNRGWGWRQEVAVSTAEDAVARVLVVGAALARASEQVFDSSVVENVIIEIPVDARVTFFEVTPGGSLELDLELPQVVADNGRVISVLIERPGHVLQSVPALRPGTLLHFEERPDEPDDLADYEERRLEGETLRRGNGRDGWDLRLGS